MTGGTVVAGIAWSTLRTRWVSFAGAFVALCLGTGLIATMTQALAASSGSQDLENAQGMAGTTTAIAVCVATFIVIATFAFVVDQRTRELALFRLVGATPRQIRRMVLAESGLIGVAAAAVGCGLGSAGTGWLSHWMVTNGVAPAGFRIGFQPVAVVIAFGLGVAAALAGAAVTAWRASRVRPVAALRSAEASRRAMTWPRWILGAGMLAGAVITGIVIASSTPEYLVNPRKYLLVPLLYTGGVALLAPVLLRPVSWLVTWPMSRLTASSLLIRQNILNGRRRTAAMVTPAVVALGLVAAMVCLKDTGAYTKVEQVRETVHAAAVSSSAVTEDGAVPVADVPVTIAVDGQVVDSLDGQVVTPSALGSVLTPRVLQGSLHGLSRNFLVVDERTAQGDGLSLGQTLTVELPGGAREPARIEAIIQSGLSGDDTYLSSALDPSARPSVVYLPRVVSGSQPMAAYLAAMTARLRTQDNTAALVTLGLSVGYALIAIANTMVMAAAGRRRELAAMGLAGATRRQVLAVVAGEAVVSVVVAALLAVPVGVAEIVTQDLALKHLIARVPVIGQAVPWTDLGQVAALCAGIGVVSAALAGWRATRGNAVDLIRE
jgi:putative ABC transport system permease protein